MFGCALLQVIMMVKVLLVPVFFLLASSTGVCPLTEVYVKAGEMVALWCPKDSHGGARLIWTSHTNQETNLTNMSPAEQRQMGVLLHGRTLVTLSASVNQGNYSCSTGSVSRQSWFSLTVYTTKTKEIEERTTYPANCFTKEAYTLNCPDVNTPFENIPNMTSNDIVWHKKGETLPKDGYFSSVEEKDSGVYTCTRSYLYHGQIYNMTFTVLLDVQPSKKSDKSATITSPPKDSEIDVDLGSPVEIACKAVMYKDSDSLFWLSGESVLDSSQVLYNKKRENNSEEIKMTATLVFKKVSQEDISKNYSCKLESVDQTFSFVTITLVQKPRPSYIPLALGIVGIVVAMVLTVVIYVKFKINITLFLRDTLGCHRITSDGKSYDAFLMYYKSDTGAGLDDYDRKRMRSVLEDWFGYSLCLCDRDILPGNAVSEAVLDCIEQSRTVVLVPTSPDLGPGSGLLSAIHAALVERQTRLVLIKTEATEVSRSGSIPEALQLLGEAGDCVTWKGKSSMSPSSSFWKQLRYYLPAPQHAPKRLLSDHPGYCLNI